MENKFLPYWFKILIRIFIPKDEMIHFEGDIQEVFYEIKKEKSSLDSNLWLLLQLIITVPPLFLDYLFWRNAMLKSYIKLALRNIGRHKIFSAINIAGFTFSLSICLITIQLIFSLYGVDRHHKDSDKINRIITQEVMSSYGVSRQATTSLPLYHELKQLEGVENVVRINKKLAGSVKINDSFIPVGGLFVDADFLKLFSFNLESGDLTTALTKPYSIIIKKSVSKKLFGDEQSVGKVIRFSNLGEYTITGILEDFPQSKTHFPIQALASFSTVQLLEEQKVFSKSINDWEVTTGGYVYFKASDEGIMNVQRRLSKIKETHLNNEKSIIEFQIQPLLDITPGELLANPIGNVTPVELAYILSLIPLVILGVAIFNYTNLTVSKSLSRSREVGIRKVIGATKKNIFNQFIGESIILAVISFIFAVAILPGIISGLYSISNVFEKFFDLREYYSASVFGVFFIFTVFAGLVAGIFPALLLSKFNPVTVLRDVNKTSIFNRFNLKKFLIVVQFSLSILLIIVTIVTYKQMEFLKVSDYGFNYDHIINVELGKVKYDQLYNELNNQVEIEEISGAGFPPGIGRAFGDVVNFPGHPPNIQVYTLPATKNFIQNTSIKLLAGRSFTKDLCENETSVIINEKTLQYLNVKTPDEAIGRTITVRDNLKLEVIGVVKDFIIINYDWDIEPLLIRSNRMIEYMNIKYNPNNFASLKEKLEIAWTKLDPVNQLKFEIYETQILDTYEGPNTLIKVGGFLSMLILMIAFFGLLGLVIFEMESKVKEIGIRKVLGASISEIVLTISKGFFKLLIISIVVALPLSYLASNAIISSMIAQMKLGITPFIIGLSLVAGIGFVIIFSQTFRAAKNNPVESLRSE